MLYDHKQFLINLLLITPHYFDGLLLSIHCTIPCMSTFYERFMTTLLERCQLSREIHQGSVIRTIRLIARYEATALLRSSTRSKKKDQYTKKTEIMNLFTVSYFRMLSTFESMRDPCHVINDKYHGYILEISNQ